MGNLGLLFLPTLGGYCLLRWIHYTRYSLIQEPGYHVLFKSAVAGCFLFVGSRILILFFFNPNFTLVFSDPTLCNAVESWVSFISMYNIETAVMSAILGVILPFPVNKVYGGEKALLRTSKKNGTLLEGIIRELNKSNKMIEISLKNRKCYVGYVINFRPALTPDGDAHIAILPVRSGYRDDSTLNLEFTTNYIPSLIKFSEIYTDFPDSEFFRIVIPISEIMSARIFDPKLFSVFEKEEKKET